MVLTYLLLAVDKEKQSEYHETIDNGYCHLSDLSMRHLKSLYMTSEASRQSYLRKKNNFCDQEENLPAPLSRLIRKISIFEPLNTAQSPLNTVFQPIKLQYIKRKRAVNSLKNPVKLRDFLFKITLIAALVYLQIIFSSHKRVQYSQIAYQ